MTIRLSLKQAPAAPLEAESICPDRFAGHGRADIAALPVFHGNQAARLGDFFDVTGEADGAIEVEGDCSRVKYIGARMTQGRISVYGNAGMHLGAEMSGGEIVVEGNASDWAGAEMRGGLIRVRGNAGHCLGAAYRGSSSGMDRGVIIVLGDAGNEIGNGLRRGLIAVGGNAGDFAGCFAIAGTIVVLGRLGRRPGAEMKRASLVTMQPAELLPTYAYDCVYRPTFVRLLVKQLRSAGLPVKEEYAAGRYRRYSGDRTTLGKGEILMWEGL